MHHVVVARPCCRCASCCGASGSSPVRYCCALNALLTCWLTLTIFDIQRSVLIFHPAV